MLMSVNYKNPVQLENKGPRILADSHGT